ncbi:MAG: GNAT family N-acetyltransferase [Geminicoccaceae bacterium]
MNTLPIWKAADLDDPDARAAAIAFSADVMTQSGAPHLRHDLEWALADQRDDRVTALCLEDEDAQGFGLLTRQERPLSFQLGELTYYRHPLTRYHLWSGPVITGAAPGSERWAALALGFLTAAGDRLGQSGAVLGIEGLSTECAFHRLLADNPKVTGNFLVMQQGEAYAHQRIDMPETLEDYLSGLGSRSKKSLRYSRRRLFRDFADDVSLKRCSADEDIPNFLDQAIAISKTTYQWHLLGLGLRRGDVLEERMRFAAKRGWLRCYLLECAGKPAAFMLAYQYQGRFYYTDVGYDPEFARWSVGSVLQLLVMEELYEQPDRPEQFDFATGYGEHKARFGNASSEEANWLLLPRSLRNTVLLGAYKRLDGLANLATSTADRIGVKQTLKRTMRRLSTGRAA